MLRRLRMWLARARSSALLGALRPLPRALPSLRATPSVLLSRAPSMSCSTVAHETSAAPGAEATAPGAEVDGLSAAMATPRRGPRPEDRPRGDTSRKYVKVDEEGWAYSRGSRKRAVAQVWVREVQEGETADVSVNGKSLPEWAGGHWAYRLNILEPFLETDTVGKFKVVARTRGGGMSGARAPEVPNVARSRALRPPSPTRRARCAPPWARCYLPSPLPALDARLRERDLAGRGVDPARWPRRAWAT